MNKDNKYISLHLHTTKGSIGDSILDIDDYIEKAKQLGLKALSITNHGSMADCFEFYQKCKDNNIKPIIGLDIKYLFSNILLYAKNINGYYNLIKLESLKQDKKIDLKDLKFIIYFIYY